MEKARLMRQERLVFESLFYHLTFPGEESGQKLAQAVAGISAILDLVVVGEGP